jgi:hypothetical protein
MFACTNCDERFRNIWQLRMHARSCETLRQPDMTSSSPTIATHPASAMSVPVLSDNYDNDNITGSTDPLFSREQRNGNNTLDANGVAITNAMLSALDKRYSPEVCLKKIVTREDARLSALWTNRNYAVLSQLTNSLSLSQSDINRVLSAVKKLIHYNFFLTILS